MKVGSLCSGYGGLDLAVRNVFGGELAWWSDIEAAPIKVMTHHHPHAPNLGDLKTIDWSAVAPVDILTAGYPCQPFSNAGKRLGTEDPRHLWPWITRAIGVLRPGLVVLENVAAHLRRGFDVVTADLAGLGYDAAWNVVRASDVGAPHRRSRLFIVAADATREHDNRSRGTGTGRRDEYPDGRREAAADTAGVRRGEGRPEPEGILGRPDAAGGGEQVDWQEFSAAIHHWESVLGRPAPDPSAIGPRGGVKVAPAFGEWLMGLPAGHVTDVGGLSINEMLKLIGNGVVPQQGEAAIRHLHQFAAGSAA